MKEGAVSGKDYIELTTEQQNLIAPSIAVNFDVVPCDLIDGSLQLYIPTGKETTGFEEELELLLGKPVQFIEAPIELIRKTIARYYRRGSGEGVSSINVQQNEKDFLGKLIQEAESLGSSDIHIETYEDRCRVRIRIDGKLIEKYTIDVEKYPSLINKIKIMANLDIAEKRLPQDGRINFETADRQFDMRVSVLPTLHGEKVVMRILSNDATNIDIEKLGFGELELKNYMEGTKKPNGILLISGPTGSGKTTTLYATLKLLNDEYTNIVTVEDPIEYTLEGINQVQLRENIGLTFGSALRSFLRQDPDVIMVGEIRDADTAEMAIRAALTGHLVLSTIHTNSAWGTISRLIDMDVPPFLLASTMNTTVAQRLIRKLCPHCKTPKAFDSSILPSSFKPVSVPSEYYVATGCEECYYTGYKGRKAVYEVIPIDGHLTNEIKAGNFVVDEYLQSKNIKTLAENAFTIFCEGNTSIEEIYPLLINQEY